MRAPSPQQAWSHVMTRGEKRAAAKALIPASTAPAPRPETKPKATTGGHHGVAAQTAAEAATRRQLETSSRPTPSRSRSGPALKLEAR